MKDDGIPEVNLCLAVLGEAKRTRSKMWRDFKLHYPIAHRVDPMAVALWVGGWWRRDMHPELKKRGGDI